MATDLSVRCDRAFDRACDLALAWGAPLYVLTAAEHDFRKPSWRSLETEISSKARTQAKAAVGNRPIRWEVIVRSGAPYEVVIRAAKEMNCQLIVTGIGSQELLGRASSGETVDTLILRAPVPVLVVKRRNEGGYNHALVPTDYSQAAELALIRAMALFPEAEYTLLHGYRVPFSGFLSEEANYAEIKALKVGEQDRFIDRVAQQTGRRDRFVPLIEYGDPDQLAADFLRVHNIDLMVLGTHDITARWLTADMARRLLRAVDCDVLAIPEASQKLA